MRRWLRWPSPAMVIACLALFVALAGTSVAVVGALPKNSVGTAQLKDNAVTSRKVKNGSLKLADFAGGQLAELAGPAGPAGAVGPAGAKGDKGDKGDPGISGLERVQGSFVTGSGAHTATAQCPSGKKALGGGWSTATPGSAGVGITTAGVASDGVTYRVDGVYLGSGNWTLVAFANCANVQ